MWNNPLMGLTFTRDHQGQGPLTKWDSCKFRWFGICGEKSILRNWVCDGRWASLQLFVVYCDHSWCICAFEHSGFYVPTPKSGEDSAVFRPEIVWHEGMDIYIYLIIYIFNYIYIYISCTVSHDDGDRLCWRVAVGSSLGSVPENGVPGTRKKAPTWESISGMLRFWYWSLEHVRTVKTSKRFWFSYVSIIIIIIIYIVIHYPPTLQ